MINFRVLVILFLTCLTAKTQTCNSNLTDAERTNILNEFNYLRVRIASGQATNKNGTTLPKATNMYKLTWSRVLETKAAVLILITDPLQPPYANRHQYSYADMPHPYNNSETLRQAIKVWYGELAENGIESLNVNESFNNFTKLAWAQNYLVGCAAQFRPDTILDEFDDSRGFAVCFFGPGNGTTLYETGVVAGSNCPENSTVDNQKLCNVNNLDPIHDWSKFF